MSFRHTTLATAVVCLFLAGVWFALPRWILTHWGLDYAYGAGVLARRMACFFLGLSVILYGMRVIEDRAMQNVVTRGVLTVCGGLIALGLYERLSGHANSGALYAVGLESAIAVAFLMVGPRAYAEPQVRLH